MGEGWGAGWPVNVNRPKMQSLVFLQIETVNYKLAIACNDIIDFKDSKEVTV